MRDVIQIAVALTPNYEQHGAVLIRSILEFHQSEEVHVHLLIPAGCSLSGKMSGCLAEWRVSYTVHQIDCDYFSGFIKTRHTEATYFRLLLPSLLPSLTRVIYLDVDIVVNGPITELWDEDLCGNALAAVANPAPLKVGTATVQLREPGYFNAGVLIIDLDEWRKIDLLQFVGDYLRENPESIFPDQDALNRFFRGWVKMLSPKFNAQNGFFVTGVQWKQKFSKEEFRGAVRRPVLVHYSSKTKPWHYLCTHPYRRLYWKYLKQTPWAGYTPPDRNLKTICFTRPIRLFNNRVFIPFIHMQPEWLKKAIKRVFCGKVIKCSM